MRCIIVARSNYEDHTGRYLKGDVLRRDRGKPIVFRGYWEAYRYSCECISDDATLMHGAHQIKTLKKGEKVQNKITV